MSEQFSPSDLLVQTYCRIPKSLRLSFRIEGFRDLQLLPRRVPSGHNLQMAQQGADILTAGVHLLFRPQPLTAPLNQQGGNAPLHRPAVKPVLRSGTDPVGYSQDLGGGQGDLVDHFLPHCGEEHQWMKRLIAVSAVEISQQIGFRVQSRLQSKGQPSGKAARRIAGESSVQIDAVLRHHLFGSGIEGTGICQRQEDDVPRQSRRVQFSSQAAQCLEPHIFASMDPACDDQCSAP